MKRATYLLAAALALSACGGDESNDGSPDASQTSDPKAPIFLNFGTNVTTLTGGHDDEPGDGGESVVFTAVLTDPDGIDDLIGGSLTDVTGAIQYGAFSTSGQEGAYTITLSWNAINQAKDISFRQMTERTFMAVFFDVAGHRVEKSVAIKLTCGGEYACHGTCSTYCGLNSPVRASCDAACASDQMTCDATDGDRRAFYGSPSNSAYDFLETCATLPTATYEGRAFRLVECLCIPAN